MDMT